MRFTPGTPREDRAISLFHPATVVKTLDVQNARVSGNLPIKCQPVALGLHNIGQAMDAARDGTDKVWVHRQGTPSSTIKQRSGAR